MTHKSLNQALARAKILAKSALVMATETVIAIVEAVRTKTARKMAAKLTTLKMKVTSILMIQQQILMMTQRNQAQRANAVALARVMAPKANLAQPA
jgi:hypothetical protein